MFKKTIVAVAGISVLAGTVITSSPASASTPSIAKASYSNSTKLAKYQPLARSYKISSGFGYRIHPVTKKKGTFHKGLDYPASCGTPILATHDGYVSRSSYDARGYGHYIQLKTSDSKLTSLYGHMRVKTHLKVGTRVYAGQRIGYVGTTGSSTGCHVHYEHRNATIKGQTYMGVPFDPTKRMRVTPHISKPITTTGTYKTYYSRNSTNTGYPRANAKKLVKKGSFQSFQKGAVYSSSKGTYLNKGAIRSAYKTAKYEKGKLGYPASEEKTFKNKKGAKYQKYQGGLITYSSKTGAKSMSGAILNEWKDEGSEKSKLGLPVTNEYKSGTTVKQKFEKGYIVKPKSQSAKTIITK